MIGKAEKKANGGERDLNRVFEITELLENRVGLIDSAVERLKRKLSSEVTTAAMGNTGGEVAPTPLVRKLVASVYWGKSKLGVVLET